MVLPLVASGESGIKWYFLMALFYDPVHYSTIVGTRVEFGGWCPSNVERSLYAVDAYPGRYRNLSLLTKAYG